MTNFLLELMSEEMPASLIEDSSSKIVQLFCNSFKKDKLIYDNYNVYYGPKRLTFIFFNLVNFFVMFPFFGSAGRTSVQCGQRNPFSLLCIFNEKSCQVGLPFRLVHLCIYRLGWRNMMSREALGR